MYKAQIVIYEYHVQRMFGIALSLKLQALIDTDRRTFKPVSELAWPAIFRLND